MAAGSLPYSATDPQTPGVCRRLCLRPHNAAHAHCRRTRPQDHWPYQADDFVERPDTRSPPRLHQLGAVRGEPEADLGERAYAAPDRTEVGARWPRPAHRFGTLRSLRPDDASVLRLAVGSCLSLPLSR